MDTHLGEFTKTSLYFVVFGAESINLETYSQHVTGAPGLFTTSLLTVVLLSQIFISIPDETRNSLLTRMVVVKQLYFFLELHNIFSATGTGFQ